MLINNGTAATFSPNYTTLMYLRAALQMVAQTRKIRHWTVAFMFILNCRNLQRGSAESFWSLGLSLLKLPFLSVFRPWVCETHVRCTSFLYSWCSSSREIIKKQASTLPLRDSSQSSVSVPFKYFLSIDGGYSYCERLRGTYRAVKF